MICTDTLVGDIPKSCSQKRLRGYTGNIKLYDYRGYVLNQSQYDNSVGLEADPYSIIPMGQPTVRGDNITVYTHTCEFTLQNEDPDKVKALSDFTQIPVVVRCELESGEWVECFSLTGGKLLLSNNLGQGVDADKNKVSFQHFDPSALEPYPPLEKALTVNYTQPIVSLSMPYSSPGETGRVITLTLTPGFTQNDAGAVNQVVFKQDGNIIQTQSDLTPFVIGVEAILGDIVMSVEISYDAGVIKLDELGNPAAGQILAGTSIASKNFTGGLRKWFGPYGITPPTIGTDIRTLDYSYDETFILQTGNTSLYQVIAVPTTREIVSVIDLDAASLDITTAYLLSGSILRVPDGGGTLIDYNVYLSQTALPYSFSHQHSVTLKTVIPTPSYIETINFEDDFENGIKWSPDIIMQGSQDKGSIPPNIVCSTLGADFTQVNSPRKITVDFDFIISDIYATSNSVFELYSTNTGSKRLFALRVSATSDQVGLIVDLTQYTVTDPITDTWRTVRIEADIEANNIKVFFDNVKIFDEVIPQGYIDTAYSDVARGQFRSNHGALEYFSIDNVIIKTFT